MQCSEGGILYIDQDEDTTAGGHSSGGAYINDDPLRERRELVDSFWRDRRMKEWVKRDNKARDVKLRDETKRRTGRLLGRFGFIKR